MLGIWSAKNEIVLVFLYNTRLHSIPNSDAVPLIRIENDIQMGPSKKLD